MFVHLFFFSIPFVISALFFFSLPPTIVVAQLRGRIVIIIIFLIVGRMGKNHIAGSSPPSPVRFVPCILIAGLPQPFLPSSSRVELHIPTLGALSSLMGGCDRR